MYGGGLFADNNYLLLLYSEVKGSYITEGTNFELRILPGNQHELSEGCFSGKIRRGTPW